VNPTLAYQSVLEGATITANNFDERTDGPLRRALDHDPNRMVRMADASSTWNTQIELRFDMSGAGALLDAADRLFIPAGHNLASCDSWKLKKSATGFGSMSDVYTESSPAAGVIWVSLTEIATTFTYIALEINDADRASSQVIYEIGELFLCNPFTLTRGVDPDWLHTIVKNQRVSESESGLVRVVKRGDDRRRLRYSWNALAAGVGSDTEKIEDLIGSDQSAVGFPVVPAGESDPIFVRLSNHEGPTQDHPNPQLAESYRATLELTQVL
jgi:hypothetical protein